MIRFARGGKDFRIAIKYILSEPFCNDAAWFMIFRAPEK
jgi:hypothetical protein